MSAPRRSNRPAERRFSDEDYQSILTFRTRLRGFLAWSSAQARAAGLTPAQHQLLLAVRGHFDPKGPTIGEIADYLHLRHHSAVGLVDRAEAAGLVRRRDDADDRRVARVELLPDGEAALEELTALHVAELRALADGLSLPDMAADGPPLPDGAEEGGEEGGGAGVGGNRSDRPKSLG